jgi:putative flippase GtrA
MTRANDRLFALRAGIIAGVFAQPVLYNVYPAAPWWGYPALLLLAITVPPLFIAVTRRLRLLGKSFPRFVIVGGLTTFVDLGVLNLLLHAFADGDSHARIFPVLATVSFVAATLNSYLWNRFWTFQGGGAGGGKEISRFYLVTLTSFCVNVGISSLLVWLDPFQGLGDALWANIAKLLATGVSLFLNFLGYAKLVFRSR